MKLGDEAAGSFRIVHIMRWNSGLASALLCVCAAAGARAQVPGADAAREDQAAQENKEQQAAAKPAAPAAPAVQNVAKPKWTGSITGGFQFSRGQTNANGVSVMGDAQYAQQQRGYRFEGIILFATVNTPIAPNTTVKFTAQDRRNLYFTFFQNIKGPIFLVSRASLEHDVLRDVKIRGMDLTGIGIRLSQSQKFQAFVAPGLGLAVENKPGVRDGAVFTPGVFQRATWHVSRIWTVDQWVQYRVNPDNSHDYALDAYGGITGLIYTTKLGFNFSYVYSYEGLVKSYGGNVVPSPPYRSLSQTTIGLRYNL